MKLCKDCKWFEKSSVGDEYNKCTFGPRRYSRWEFCSLERVEGFIWCRLMRSCGRSGRRFKPKQDGSKT